MSSPHNSHGSIAIQWLNCVQLLATPWTIARQAPLPMGFPRQGYWSGLPFSSPKDLSDQGIERISCIGRWILYHWATREAPAMGTQVLLLSLFYTDKDNGTQRDWVTCPKSASHPWAKRLQSEVFQLCSPCPHPSVSLACCFKSWNVCDLPKLQSAWLIWGIFSFLMTFDNLFAKIRVTPVLNSIELKVNSFFFFFFSFLQSGFHPWI